ncbi:MAG TPA: hypothetical protein IAB02_03110 [Candidatus Pullichristensenella excrementigallinarum]|uniref:beta-lactamase n=1 Tax=Candidatus Pullichristensenella excrementigallinarum TaxID=2840907 RepID=A0A9D1IAS2_9FIRM|nr:hypothetical protein [Candidatus Pullichristensenella excrementigallinarum]
MRQTKPLKPFTGRILILSGILVVVFAAIFLRMNVMMRTNYESYAQTASSSATKTLSVTGMRGTIYDTNMTPLAYDRVSYNVTFYRDPSKMSEEDRWNYTKSILETIRLVDSNGKTTINEFWLQKDEDNVWRFKTGSTSETVEQTRENQWRANFRETSTPEEDLMDSLLEKYFVLDVLRDELWQEYGEEYADAISDEELFEQNEELIVRILSVWQASRMNAFNSKPVAIAYDVGFETVSEVESRATELDGMSCEESSVRVYPQGTTACHIVGYTGKISSEENLETYKAKGYPTDAMVGVSGIEASMEDQLSPYLSYRQGERVVEIDTRGKIVRELSYSAPVDGNSIVLTIDSQLEVVMAEALQKAILKINSQQRQTMRSETWQRNNATELARYEDMGYEVQLAETGAMVAMDPNSGRVLGYVSLPNYDLSLFEGGISAGDWYDIAMDENNPLFDRVISAKDAPGSTFKLCTALAGLAEGVLGIDERIDDLGGFVKTDPTNPAKCWTRYIQNHQNQTVVEGLKNSCNYFFYEVGYRLGNEKITQWAAALGLTSRTNIELPGEATSFVGNQSMLYNPDLPIESQQTYKPQIVANSLRSLILQIGEDRNIEYEEERIDEVVKKLMDISVSYETKAEWARPIREVLLYDLNLPEQYISSNYLGNTITTYIQDLFWTPNETIMLAIGQSITQVTPIAMARYVSAIANGGTVYDAQIIDKIIAPDGTIVLEKEPVVANQIVTEEAYFQAIQEGMKQVTSTENEGSAADEFTNSKYPIAAKTGTSQRTEIDVENNSWILCYAPADDPKIAVVVYIQNGYAGARSASAAIDTITYYLDNYGGYEDSTVAIEYSAAE